MNTIPRDRRRIVSLRLGPNEAYEVGAADVTEITAYSEGGLLTHIPYFAVKCGDDLVARIPAQMAICVYAEEQ